MNKILIIQTAFIGDVILATSLVDLIKKEHPTLRIDFLLRNGNEALVKGHPAIEKTWVWNKSQNKFRNLFKLTWQVRREKYDAVINIQRFFNSGFITALSGAKIKVGFDKNPMSFFFTHKVQHQIPHFIGEQFLHEVQRNALLYQAFTPNWTMPEAKSIRPSLFPSEQDWQKVQTIVGNQKDYLVFAPASVWETKQWPIVKWQELTKQLSSKYKIYFIGAPTDHNLCQAIIGENPNCENLCGQLNLLQSAALMKNARRTFANDSAPLHLASAMNAKVTAFYCSTIPEFGYFPISDDSQIIDRQPRLECTPCGLHGKKACPLGHFKCGMEANFSNSDL